MGNALNLREINQEQAFNLSKFYIRSNQNLFIFGQRGTGKTDILLQAIRECGYKTNYINLSVVDRSDICGYPNINSKDDIITFKSPHYLPKLINNKPDCVLLFDEVDKAPPEVTAPLLEILQFKTINGTKLNVASCVLTGNLLNEGAYSNLISTALLDRGAKYILSFNFDNWINWAKNNNIHDLILVFLKNNPELTCGKIDDSCYASPSPRGWSLASEALLKAKELKIVDIDTVAQIVSGFVGNDAGLKFKIWFQYYRKFEPYVHSLIDSGSMALNFNDLIPTEKIVFVIAACYYAKQKTFDNLLKTKNKFLYLENLCKFFNVYNVDNEIQVIGLHNSFSFDQIALHKLYGCKMFFDLFTKLSDGITINK